MERTLHFASIDEVIAEVRAAGMALVRGPDGVSVFVCDPDGVRVELRLAS